MNEQILIFSQIVLIDLVLAGDNAIIIGMVASRFPADQRKKIIFWGIGGAIILRIILTLLTAYLLQINGLRLIGGLALLYICYKLYQDVIKNSHSDQENINIDSIELKAIYTPGHTDCSYSYLMNDRVFTGDTLLINGTGRTDFQNGSAHEAYESIFGKLLKLPEETLVYPAHDYNGKKNSTIGNEKSNNPRLQVSSKEEYAEIMDNLNLANPKMMDIAVPANLKGLTLKEL